MSERSSLVRFMNDKGDGDERGNLFWHRAGEDGAPFRGPSPPALREEEFEQQTARVGDPHVKIFRISPEFPEEIKAYQDVLAKVVNGGWGQVLHVDRQFSEEKGYWMVYMEWVQWYIESANPEATQLQQVPTNGQHGQPTNGQQPPIPYPYVPSSEQGGAGPGAL